MLTFDLFRQLKDLHIVKVGAPPDFFLMNSTHHNELNLLFVGTPLTPPGMAAYYVESIPIYFNTNVKPQTINAGIVGDLRPMHTLTFNGVSFPVPDLQAEIDRIDANIRETFSASHSCTWENYQGFTESYEYCDCGKKR